MGGHGGLNILPQKRWNVYNYENREKVRRDEEAAAREEQLKREQARKRDAEFRLERLRGARGLAPLNKSEDPASEPAAEPASEPAAEPADSEPKTGHINLFEGIKIFDPIKNSENDGVSEGDEHKKKKMKKEDAAPRIITPEDEKYRLGYGLAGKGVKLPWYLEKRSDDGKDNTGGDGESSREVKEEKKKNGKKTLEELRQERLKREKREKEREKALISGQSRRNGAIMHDKRFRRR